MKSLLSTLSFKKIDLSNKGEVYSGMKLYLQLASNTYGLELLTNEKLDELAVSFLQSAHKNNGNPYLILVNQQAIGWLYYYTDSESLVIKNLYLEVNYQGVQLGPAILLGLAQLYKKTISFEILASNQAANSFARKLGAEIVGCDAWILNEQKIAINIYLVPWPKVVDVLEHKVNATLLMRTQQCLGEADNS